MQYREVSRPVLLLVLVFLLLCGGIANRTLSAKNENNTQNPNASASPSPTPRNREEVPQDSDEVIKVETNLTNIFFTAADKNKRFISDLKAGRHPRYLKTVNRRRFLLFNRTSIFRFRIAILIDTSISESVRCLTKRKPHERFLRMCCDQAKTRQQLFHLLVRQLWSRASRAASIDLEEPSTMSSLFRPRVISVGT